MPSATRGFEKALLVEPEDRRANGGAGDPEPLDEPSFQHSLPGSEFSRQNHLTQSDERSRCLHPAARTSHVDNIHSLSPLPA